MDTQTLPQLRMAYRQAEAAYQEALHDYIAAYVDRRARTVRAAHSARCHAYGARLDAALAALIDALWFPLNDPGQVAEQRRLMARQAMLARELRLLGPKGG